MRNPILLLLIFVLVLGGCKKKNSCTISGIVTNGVFDGEQLYLVPFNNPSKERVDSTLIVNGRFNFHMPCDSADIFILRAKPVLRLKLQELLIVKEPGVLLVNLGESSFVTGTALNDSLQKWKDLKMKLDSITKIPLQQNLNYLEDQQFSSRNDSLEAMLIGHHFHFAKNNQKNVVGQMVYSLMKSSFTPLQRMEFEK